MPGRTSTPTSSVDWTATAAGSPVEFYAASDPVRRGQAPTLSRRRKEHATGVTECEFSRSRLSSRTRALISDFTGLHDYQSPQPIVVSRARSISSEALTENRGPWHSHPWTLAGRTSTEWLWLNSRPQGISSREGADFRRASLASMDLSGVAADFEYAFFTCAGLGRADFGTANLLGADLSGAHLEGADLSEVQNLTSRAAARCDDRAADRSAGGSRRRSDEAWGLGSATCNTVVNNMTGMQAGWGYLSTHPCPTTLEVGAQHGVRHAIRWEARGPCRGLQHPGGARSRNCSSGDAKPRLRFAVTCPPARQHPAASATRPRRGTRSRTPRARRRTTTAARRRSAGRCSARELGGLQRGLGGAGPPSGGRRTRRTPRDRGPARSPRWRRRG